MLICIWHFKRRAVLLLRTEPVPSSCRDLHVLSSQLSLWKLKHDISLIRDQLLLWNANALSD